MIASAAPEFVNKLQGALWQAYGGPVKFVGVVVLVVVACVVVGGFVAKASR